MLFFSVRQRNPQSRLQYMALHKKLNSTIFLACEAGESIKPGALAPGQRDVTNQPVKRAKAADFLAFARFAGCIRNRSLPGADAPGFMLSPASQATSPD